MRQIFIAAGFVPDGASYVYPFDDPDEAMQFVAWVREHNDDGVVEWTILTETPTTARRAYDAHRKWVED